MVSGNAVFAAGTEKKVRTVSPLKMFLSRHFYFCMSMVLGVIVVWGFSRTADANLFHANPPRPRLLWIHGAAFSAWVVFFIMQSALVRVRKVSVHRLLGWFGAALATVMVALGFAIAVIMTRFDTVVLHQNGIESFLSVPFEAMLAFGTCTALAILKRKQPEFHRRLILIASCNVMNAAFDRFDFIFNNNLGYVGLDLLILLGMVRDWVVDRRVHKVYVYALPSLIALQSFAMYLWKIDPRWWQGITHTILGL